MVPRWPPNSAALSADHLEYTECRGRRGDGGGRHASPCCCRARSTRCAKRACRRSTALRERGVPIAIATDLNPGTSPLLSLRLAINMACTLFRLTPEEALRGATVNAARALGLSDRGRLAQGQRADLVVWNAREPAELGYWIGGSLLQRAFAGGRELQARQ